MKDLIIKVNEIMQPYLKYLMKETIKFRKEYRKAIKEKRENAKNGIIEIPMPLEDI